MAYLNQAAGKARESGGGVLTNAGVPSAGTSEVQTVATTGTPTGGTFKLAFEGRATAAIVYNAAAAAVQSALEALPNIGSGGVVCGGGPLPTGVTVTFSGNLARRAVALLTLFSNDLTPAGSTGVTITETTPGVDATYRDAPVGSAVMDTTNAKLYVKTGTMAAPTYTVAGTQT
jgi:hypothetical protein